MNGIHDLGGMHGLGPVDREENEPVFHHEWEARLAGVWRATRAIGLYNLDEYRHGVERMDPAAYLEASYYERVYHSIRTLLLEKGIFTAEELETGHVRDGAPPLPQPRFTSEMVERMFAPAPPHVDPEGVAARFAVGDHVRARNVHPVGHTRLPRYVRGKQGVVATVRGVYHFADTNAHGQGLNPQFVYSVRFTARELWGPAANPRDTLHIDLYDDYLERVTRNE